MKTNLFRFCLQLYFVVFLGVKCRAPWFHDVTPLSAWRQPRVCDSFFFHLKYSHKRLLLLFICCFLYDRRKMLFNLICYIIAVKIWIIFNILYDEGNKALKIEIEALTLVSKYLSMRVLTSSLTCWKTRGNLANTSSARSKRVSVSTI